MSVVLVGALELQTDRKDTGADDHKTPSNDLRLRLCLRPGTELATLARISILDKTSKWNIRVQVTIPICGSDVIATSGPITFLC
jgi:hypothetical protein